MSKLAATPVVIQRLARRPLDARNGVAEEIVHFRRMGKIDQMSGTGDDLVGVEEMDRAAGARVGELPKPPFPGRILSEFSQIAMRHG